MLALVGFGAPTANSVTLAWNPSSDPTLAGYRVYQGVASQTYTNVLSVGTATNATVSGLTGGVTYFFAVTAYDTDGLESPYSNQITYTPSNALPVVSLTAPVSGASYMGPANIACSASVTANGHTINSVKFYSGSNLIAQAAAAPYTCVWSNVSAGSYVLSAAALYDGGNLVSSAAAPVTVTNPLPFIALTSPSDGANYTAPATINLAATVTPNGHVINQVQFLDGSNLIAAEASPPYSYTWTNATVGSHLLSAAAIFDSVGTVASSPAQVTVALAQAPALPPPWQSLDIGTVGLAGSASINGGLYALSGAGNLTGTADSFYFVFQPMTGNGEIRAQISSIQSRGTGALAGVMVRETLTPGARYVFMGISPSGAFDSKMRSSTSGTTTSKASGSGVLPNTWVRVVRSNSKWYIYKSTNGSNWTRVSSASIAMASSVYMGFAVCSGSTNALESVAFTNATIVP
ncbi:MAG TPA: Ig-like domain-containing protein [Verrucomicrobiae bacterium]|nr:Ig-like domain-containing protein [Verrucomicrobiae bacterium]